MDTSKAYMVLKKVERNKYGQPEIKTISYEFESISNIRYGKFKDFCSEEDIIGNDLNPNDAAIYITFYPENNSDECNTATLSGDWEIEFEW